MNSPNKFDEFKIYVRECLRLLYWTYFKPNTLSQWLQDIHPQLKPNTNLIVWKLSIKESPFSLRKDFWNLIGLFVDIKFRGRLNFY